MPIPSTSGTAYYVDHRDPNAGKRALRLLPHLPADTTFLTASNELHRRLADRPVHRLTNGPFQSIAKQRDTIAVAELQLRAWVSEHRPRLVLCDAPFESTDLQAYIPNLMRVRRPGYEAEDRLHRQYGNAPRVLSLGADWLESRQTPDWLRAKTYYTGCLPDPTLRPIDRAAARAACGFAAHERYIVLLKSGPHGSFSLSRLARAARHAPDYQWVRLGPLGPGQIELPPNLRQEGMVPDPDTYLRAADLVVSDGDEYTLHRVAASGTPLVCLPDPDARHAQHTYAHALRRRGMALTFDGFPRAFEWPSILERATQLSRSPWRGFYAPDAPDRVRRFLRLSQQSACA